ncbi:MULTISPECIES: 3-dehydroquinate synthase [unclassified Robiginitalea]|uniref:3-dehydroquinate synthase n=1 Tax=Robiginitalea TaxID=252306 RepID=UPI0023493C73|nr:MULTISPECIES: 3-dehydroquinate synthase [unclassified Robiginitalea]MDC6353716.1 3-dehydroquinate synthase [Robiginitalea sp. PM2]MDC6375790.1 3-dehydroquinate synthase [Robiginitalea sp. SP8]
MDRQIEKTFNVPFRHRLLFTQGVFNPENQLLADLLHAYRPGVSVKTLFVLDSGVQKAHPGLENAIQTYCGKYPEQMKCADVLVVPGGESAKNSEGPTNRVLKAIETHGICRHSVVVAIGGGAVIDMAGYAAAIAHRGVQLIRIPTTVLAQNDAAVGVKNGINFYGKKNFLGTFAVPQAIINDRDFLETLEDRDWIAGSAEAVKVALIKDAPFFEFLEREAQALRRRDPGPMQELIFRCAELHMEHIAGGGDPFEAGSSRPLDFGHWSAHKLEHLTGYGLRHGEAVALGMALDVRYSHRLGMLEPRETQRILDLLTNLGFDLHLPDLGPDGSQNLLQGLEEFREHLGGVLTITLLEGIGRKRDVHEIDRDIMAAAIAEMQPGKTANKAS